MLRIITTTILLLIIPFTVANSNITQDIWVPPAPTIQPTIFSEEKIIDPVDLDCMSKNIYFEAAVESTAGKIAVGQVVLNRMSSVKFPNTVCGVITQGKHYKNGFPIRDRCQFSWYCDGKHDVPFKGKLWKKSVEVARFLLKDREHVDITDGATFYHADYIPDPKWAKNVRKTVKIDRHIFYSSKDI